MWPLWLAAGAGALLSFFLLGVRYIHNDRIGVVEKRFSGSGSVEQGLVALEGEAGFQPDVLRGGLHWRMPFMYRVRTAPLVTIPQGRIGYVFARDGVPLHQQQSLARDVACGHFQDVAAFLRAGGQRGPQRRVLREGTYAINLAQFIVITAERIYFLPLDQDDLPLFARMQAMIAERDGFRPLVIQGEDDLLGVVTVHDGPALGQGELIAPVVGDDPREQSTYHNSFQDPERFLVAGGRRGRQLQVLVEGTYYLNRLFATVELLSKTVVEVGTVGVVVSYTGEAGNDLSGVEYKHGELVERGRRGVWSEPLLPGKYAFNTYAGKVVLVPTTNFILKWNKREIGSHRFDENLTEVSLITKDAFEPSLPLSVVVHIDYRKAPLVVQRFGDVKRLVEQTLDPMVAAYFKNVGQTRTLIELLQERSNIQEAASEEMKAKFGRYNLELEEVLIGTPASSQGDTHIEEILRQLRMRQIAEEQVETYARQERAAVKERELREAQARAEQQQHITESELSVVVQANHGRAEYERSLQQAAQIKALAEAEAERVRKMAEAEAERAARVGIAEAMAIEEQVRAYGGPQLQMTQKVMTRFSEAIEKSGVEVVPRVVVGGSTNGGGSGSSVMEALFTMLLSEKVGAESAAGTAQPQSPAAKRLREELKGQLANGRAS
ncbi:MAG: hypothetical protein JNL21_09250 [Myxococcales bacterium]|nr:hypothetical protein [Myxococcales bacterium]